MKIKIAKSQLQHPDDIWNEMTNVVIQHMYPSDNRLFDQLSIIYCYYSEMESGGHEALLNWQVNQIVAYGFDNYFNTLTSTLQQIGASSYAQIETQYLPLIWEKYLQLEQGEDVEDAFYELVDKADQAYRELNDAIRSMLEKSAVAIHLQVFEPVEEL